MTEILKGKVVADKIKERMVERIADLNKKGLEPTLAIVRLGEDPSDLSYERGIIKNSEKLGIKTVIKELDVDLFRFVK